MVSSKQFAPSPPLVSNQRPVPNATRARAATVRMPVSTAATDRSADESENPAPESVTTTPKDELQVGRQSADSPPSLRENNVASALVEDALVMRICSLWSTHTAQRSQISHSRVQMYKLRLELGKDLSDYKKLLAQTGRGGKWTSFLRQQKISRATADRYVQRWEATQTPEANRLNEAFSAPTEEQIATLAKTTAARVMKRLITPESREQFVKAFAVAFEQSPPSAV